MSSWRPTTFERRFRGWRIIVWEVGEDNEPKFWLFALRKNRRAPDTNPKAMMQVYDSAKAARIAAIKCIKSGKLKQEGKNK